jgi:caffeoyl-CoA O-methyltransferase
MEHPAEQPMRVELTPELLDYVLANSIRPSPAQTRLIDRTRKEFNDKAGMQIAAEQGALITLLCRLVGARRAVEVGTFTGYSSLAILAGLGPQGRLLCCDVSETWTAMARDAWREAGLQEQVELRIAPALETLRGLPREEYLDLCFVDADKTGYRDYYEELLPRTRPGGLLLFDNVLYGGHVLDPDSQGNAAAIREFNPALAADDRVDVVLLPIADGLTIARKR